MKTPPLLIGATLLFWGWQTGFLPEAAIMAALLESSRFVKARWEFSNDEFARVWTFCNLLFLAALIFAFNDNGGPSDFSQLFENLNSNSEKVAGNASGMTVDAVIRWLPMIFFLFVVAQTFSPVESVPLEAVSFWLRNRLKKARKRGYSMPPSRRFDIVYPYFSLCLFSAAGHAALNDYFYFGLCILIGWALWPQRSRRFSVFLWIGMMAIAATAGYFGQRGFGQISHMAEEYDPQLISFFMRSLTDPRRSWTDIGDVGEMKLSGKIVIRLQPLYGAPPPDYLREASYRKLREYDIHGSRQKHTELEWETGTTNSDSQISESPPDSGIWPLYPGAPGNRSLVNIACYLNGINRDDKYPYGLLPLPPDCNKLENSRAYFVYRSYLGSVLAEGPRLMIFEARFGSGNIMDDRPEADESMTNEDLYVPTNEIPALQTVISNLNVAGSNDEIKFMAVHKFFADNFTYSLKQDSDASDTNTTALSRFILKTHSGHCEYFATATVLLLRELGIPARYAVGYYVHEPSGAGYVVRLRDSHAWCLVWDKKKRCWQNFDTTPPSWVEKEGERASPLQFLSDTQSWLQYQVIKFFDYSHNNIREYLFWGLIPALAFLLYRIFRNSRRHKKNIEDLDLAVRPGLDSEFYQLERRLAQKSLPREPGEPLVAWLERATNDPDLAKIKKPLENIILMHYRYRFDPRGLSLSERQSLRREVQACLLSTSD